MNHRIIGIIPAKGKSTRLANKNRRDFCERPLFYHSLDVAVKSKLIDSVYVTTEDHYIRELAQKYMMDIGDKHKPIGIINRPSCLSQNTSSVIDVLRHAYNQINSPVDKKFKDEEARGDRGDMVVLLYPTYPLRTVNLVDYVISCLCSFGYGSAITMTKADKKAWWYVQYTEDKDINLYIKKIAPNQYYRSQDMPDVYRMAGAVHAIYASELKSLDRNGMNSKVRGIVVDDEDLLMEVDDIETFRIAENIFQERPNT